MNLIVKYKVNVLCRIVYHIGMSLLQQQKFRVIFWGWELGLGGLGYLNLW